VYFVRGKAADEADLIRAGIEHASSAIICPSDTSDEADLRSILTILAIETIAPRVRTVVEVNNPANVPHFRRANADEVLVTSKLASHLLARSAIYPGLSELVTDIVSGGKGSELYRVDLPEDLIGKTIDEVATRFRSEHEATVLAVSRNGEVHTNPVPGFKVQSGDNLVVVAESLGALQPLRLSTAFND
jgi:voltage-gated potassium channel